MKFGVREIANVVFRAKSNVKIGSSVRHRSGGQLGCLRRQDRVPGSGFRRSRGQLRPDPHGFHPVR